MYLNGNVCEPCNPRCSICEKNDKDKCIACSGLGEGRTKDISTNCGCVVGIIINIIYKF